MKSENLIIGSTAIKHFFSDFRDPKDTDIIGEGKSSKEVEYFQNTAFNLCSFESDESGKFATPNSMYTIKISHLAWDINFDKHIRDVLFLRDKGCQIQPVFYKELFKSWEELHGKKTVHMNVPEEEFFKEYTSRKIPHDELHQLMAFNSEPMHIRIRKDLSKPYCSEELFNSLTPDEQLQCAVEEVFVIAVERYSGLPVNHSVYKALKNLITSMTTGWFNIFLITNFDRIMKYPKDKLIEVREKLC